MTNTQHNISCPGKPWKSIRNKTVKKPLLNESPDVAILSSPEPAEIKLYSFVYQDTNTTLIRVGFIKDDILYCLTGTTPTSITMVAPVNRLYLLKEHSLPKIYQDDKMNIMFPIQKYI